MQPVDHVLKFPQLPYSLRRLLCERRRIGVLPGLDRRILEDEVAPHLLKLKPQTICLPLADAAGKLRDHAPFVSQFCSNVRQSTMSKLLVCVSTVKEAERHVEGSQQSY